MSTFFSLFAPKSFQKVSFPSCQFCRRIICSLVSHQVLLYFSHLLINNWCDSPLHESQERDECKMWQEGWQLALVQCQSINFQEKLQSAQNRQVSRKMSANDFGIGASRLVFVCVWRNIERVQISFMSRPHFATSLTKWIAKLSVLLVSISKHVVYSVCLEERKHVLHHRPAVSNVIKWNDSQLW